MKRSVRSFMALGVLGALTSMALIPAMNHGTRKKISRSARNTYFRASDIWQDFRDVIKR